MATDVLRNGPGWDLDFQAEFADDDSEPRLVAQQVQDAVSLIRGEYFLDVTAGADWIGYSTTKGEVARQAFLAQIEDEVRAVPGVAGVTSSRLTVDPNTRSVRIDLVVRFVRGQADASAVFAASPVVGIEAPGAWTWSFR